MTTRRVAWTARLSGRLGALAVALALTSACSSEGVGDALLEPSALRPELLASLTGRVLAAGEEGESPVADALVEIENGAARLVVTTDADGVYQFVGIARGRWTIAVQKEGYAAATAEVEVNATIQKDFVLQRADE